MNEELKKLFERFEIEMWLYIDGFLSSEEKNFWDEQLSKHSELKNYYENTLDSLLKYDLQNENILSDNEFKEMIDFTVNKGTILSPADNFITHILETLFSNSMSNVKVILTGVLSVIALLILLTTEKPNAVKSISKDILSWQGESINQEISSVNNSLDVLSAEEWEKYQYFKATHDDWEQTFYLIDSEIERMQKEIEDTSL